MITEIIKTLIAYTFPILWYFPHCRPRGPFNAPSLHKLFEAEARTVPYRIWRIGLWAQAKDCNSVSVGCLCYTGVHIWKPFKRYVNQHFNLHLQSSDSSSRGFPVYSFTITSFKVSTFSCSFESEKLGRTHWVPRHSGVEDDEKCYDLTRRGDTNPKAPSPRYWTVQTERGYPRNSNVIHFVFCNSSKPPTK